MVQFGIVTKIYKGVLLRISRFKMTVDCVFNRTRNNEYIFDLYYSQEHTKDSSDICRCSCNRKSRKGYTKHI